IVIGASGLPTPPGADTAVVPAGTAGNLVVLPWAGFKAALSVTLDDSTPSQIKHEPEIAATGVPVTWYITSSYNWIAGYDAALKDALAKGMDLGNHTVHHCGASLAGCSGALASIDAEVDDCTSYIKDHAGVGNVYTMAYPFGDSGYAATAQARFFLGRGISGGTVAPNDATDPFALPVYGTAGGESADPFNEKVDTARTEGKWTLFLFHGLQPDAEGWEYNPVNVTTVTGTIEHAKALGDVWIDSVTAVGAYWLGQKTFQAVTPSTAGSVTTWTWTLPAHFPPGKYLRVKVDGGSLKQGDTTLAWDGHGYYEVALDPGTLTLSP
ncbi:MAG TPA: polysaccharide deacetylase family protein, partial [Polyangiaceae bacterium]|nr:polysaccharide deacetylase family protein [Polyangiaceae bacterium]